MRKWLGHTGVWQLACGLSVRGSIAALMILMATGVALGLAHTAEDVLTLAKQDTGVGSASQWIYPTLLVLVSFAGALWLGLRSRPLPPLFYLAALVIVTLLVRGALIETVDPAWSTDYLRYWQRAVEMAADGQLSVRNIYEQRAVLVPYPIELLFGPDATVELKWANALLLLVIQLAVYDCLRLTSNHQAAQATSLLLLASPLPAYAALIPSHDLWSLFFATGVTWTAVRTWRLPAQPVQRWTCILSLGIACACFLYALELQRSVGLLLGAALLSAAILHSISRWSYPGVRPANTNGLAVLLVAGIALALHPFIGAAAATKGLDVPVSERGQTTMAMKYAAHGSAMGTGRSAWYARFADRFGDKTADGPNSTNDFARDVVLSTWATQPMGKLDAMREHAGRLFSLSYPPDWDTLLRRPRGLDKETRSALIIHIGLFGLATLGTGLSALVVTCLKPHSIAFPALLFAAFVAGLALVLLLLFENKPFNLAPAWLFYPMLLGATAGRHLPGRQRRSRSQHSRKHAIASVATGVCLLLVVGFGSWQLLRNAYDAADGLVLNDWKLELSQASSTAGGTWTEQLTRLPPRAFDPEYYVHDRRSFVLRDAPEDGARIKNRAASMYIAMQLPPGGISEGDKLVASRDVCLDGSERDMEFFMFAPYQRRGVEQAFSLDVSVDGHTIQSLPIPHRNRSDTMQRVNIASAFPRGERCHSVSISLVSNVERSAESWSRASYVEIWFPRAVDVGAN